MLTAPTLTDALGSRVSSWTNPQDPLPARHYGDLKIPDAQALIELRGQCPPRCPCLCAVRGRNVENALLVLGAPANKYLNRQKRTKRLRLPPQGSLGGREKQKKGE